MLRQSLRRLARTRSVPTSSSSSSPTSSSSSFIRTPSVHAHAHQFPRDRGFHTSSRLLVVKPFLLADIGEGIRECEIIQWFVEPGAKVEQFDNICEVQSDKASVEISSRYDGVIKKLYYEAGDMAIVGKPLVDIDMVGEEESSAVETSAEPVSESATTPSTASSTSFEAPEATQSDPSGRVRGEPSGKHAALATPAVRRMVREFGLNITDIKGTGKDGRVLKEDVTRFVESGGARDAAPKSQAQQQPQAAQVTIPPQRQFGGAHVAQAEETVALTPIQKEMFKMMTKSLSIPHFMYADEACIDPLVRLRAVVNKQLAASGAALVSKVSYMPFFIKAVSLALNEYPILNSRLDLSDEAKPKLVKRPQHNIGIAMDTPTGLIVPNIKNVNSLTVLEIAYELNRLQAAGAVGKLSSADLKGGTITLSNIGNVGGTYVAPVVVTSEVAIMGIGRSKVVPAFDEEGLVVPKTMINFSWSADHRVIDGGTMARMAALVKSYCENPELMITQLR